MFISKNIKPLKLATITVAFFAALSTFVAPITNIVIIQAQSDTTAAINSPEAYLSITGKTSSNGTVEGYTTYDYLSNKLPVNTDYAVSGLGIAVNGVIKGEVLNLSCDLETPKIISEVLSYCNDNFYNQLQALENLKNSNSQSSDKANNTSDKIKQIRPVLNNTDINKLRIECLVFRGLDNI